MLMLAVIAYTIYDYSKSPRFKSLPMGKFTSMDMTMYDFGKYLLKYKVEIRLQFMMVLDLHTKDSFRIGYCDKKICYSGNWRIMNDSILLYNIYSFPQRKIVSDKKLKFDLTEGIILFPQNIRKCVDKNGKPRMNYTLLKFGANSFDGILNKGYRIK